MSHSTLGLEDFATALGTKPERFPAELKKRIAEADFRYRHFGVEERDAVLLTVLKRLESGDLSRVGEHRQAVWDRGWEENLEQFEAQDAALESLIPRFIREEPIVRLRSEYVQALNARIEFFFHDIVRRWLFLEFMSDVRAVYEFGCGSAYNLVAIAEMAPGLRLVGLDWAESSVKLANLIGEKRGIALTGRRFDLFHPDDTLEIGPGDAALTVCALEQVGTRHEAFLEFLLRKRPSVCVHMEPLLDLYDPDNLVDHLAIRFHTARDYLSGFLPALRRLESEKRIEILAVQRMNFGSLFHEGYSFVAWRPC
jgi:hypothetical protein